MFQLPDQKIFSLCIHRNKKMSKPKINKKHYIRICLHNSHFIAVKVDNFVQKTAVTTCYLSVKHAIEYINLNIDDRT